VLEWTGSRRRLFRLAIAGAAALLAPRAGAVRPESLVSDVRVESAVPFLGDNPFLATLGGVVGRTTARLRFRLARPAVVTLETLVTGQGVASEQLATVGQTGLATRRVSLDAGRHSLEWSPDPTMPARTYILRLKAQVRGGPVAGFRTRASVSSVVRVLGVDAGFVARSAVSGQRARLVVRTDARVLTVHVIHCGPEPEPTYSNNELKGVPITEPSDVDWSTKGNRPASVDVSVADWPSGLYAVRLEADDGRVGFAPLVVRPAAPTQRIAIVLPTTTWQAYNFYDGDGDGWGDTWYAGGSPPVRLNRPYLQRGTPAWFSRREAPFLKYLRQSNKTPDFLSEDDIEAMPSGDDLRRLYDIVIYPGHTEYVTQQEYDVIQRFRDLGGRLIMLSANNFFWKVEKNGQWMRRIKLWRELGRPESAVFGVQYRANDDGSRQGVIRVMNTAVAPWLFEGTGLVDGSTLGDFVGGYGIEIDQTTAFTPPNTIVLGEIPDLYGPGLTAQMTYYETEKGARVFSAGVLDFGGSAPLWPVRRLLDNLWRHFSQ
jgi:hypothetical protein